MKSRKQLSEYIVRGENELDYEIQTSYDFTVVATDNVRGEIGNKNVYHGTMVPTEN